MFIAVSLHNRNKDAKIDLFIDQKHFPCSEKRENALSIKTKDFTLSLVTA